MKEVTIDTVRERIAELEMVNSHGELSLRGEFELACLRMLADSMGGVDDDVRSVVSLLESNEWAEHCTKTDLGQRLESEITRLVGHVQPVPVVSDAAPSLNAMMRALDAFYADGYVPERAMLAAFRILLADVRGQKQEVYNIGEATMLHIFTDTGMTDVSDMQAVFNQVEKVLVKLERKPKVIEPEGWRDMMTRLANGLELMTSLASERAISVDTCVCLEWVRDARAMLNQAQEPTTDNTAQQFEALATSAGSGKQ